MALRPFLRCLSRWDIRADAITLCSLAAGLLFIPLFPHHPALAMIAVAVHVLLDGVDGPLARFQGTASRRGSFTDTVTDQCVLAGVVLSLTNAGSLSVWTGGAFLFAYTLVVAFAMVRNALGAPYSWLIRPRFLLYAAIPVQWETSAAVLEGLTICLTAILGFKAFTGCRAIRRAL
jgi:phosphatidylglycerophosphate synthase